MPLKLIPPDSSRRQPNWRVRGKYLGIAVDRSTETASEAVAKTVFRRWKTEIERGEYRDPRAAAAVEADAGKAAKTPPTFLTAVAAYLHGGGDGRFLSPIIEAAGPSALRGKLLAEIDQAALDNACAELLPSAPATTRNRQFYTPVAAVLHHVGIRKTALEDEIKRPKGWRGSKATSWLEPEQAWRLFTAADAIDREFGLLLRFLLYTGLRLGEGLAVTLDRLNLQRGFLYVPDTKNGEPRAVYLPPALVEALRSQPPRPARPSKADGAPLRIGVAGRSRLDAGVPFLERPATARLFRFHAGSPLRKLLSEAMKDARLSFPRRQRGFHLLRHTYGTWMGRYGGLDSFGLARTDAWKDPRSADRYRHTEVTSEARRADLMPTEPASEIRAPDVRIATKTC